MKMPTKITTGMDLMRALESTTNSTAMDSIVDSLTYGEVEVRHLGDSILTIEQLIESSPDTMHAVHQHEAYQIFCQLRSVHRLMKKESAHAAVVQYLKMLGRLEAMESAMRLVQSARDLMRSML
jgi:cysteine synthase